MKKLMISFLTAVEHATQSVSIPDDSNDNFERAKVLYERLKTLNVEIHLNLQGLVFMDTAILNTLMNSVNGYKVTITTR